MKNDYHNEWSSPAIGAVAGLFGTAVMMGMRSFDQQYAPKTIPQTQADPGKFIVGQIENRLQTKVPGEATRVGALLLSLAYGMFAGVSYSIVRGRRKPPSALLDGGFLGAAVYTIGYIGWLPLTGLTRPLWKQQFPEVAGEGLRHVVFGVSTATVYRIINAWRE